MIYQGRESMVAGIQGWSSYQVSRQAVENEQELGLAIKFQALPSQ